MDTPVSLCERCAGTGKTCCQGRDIYVTPGDVCRISIHVGRHDFYEFRRSQDPAYEDQSDDPLWLRFVFRPDKTRRVLKRDGTGNCVFLKACRPGHWYVGFIRTITPPRGSIRDHRRNARFICW